MREDIEAWERMAVWWDNKLGDDGDLWHRALIDPTVFRILGDVAGEQVLDMACGNGYIARRLARMGAEVTAVDASGPVITLAREREGVDPLGITYHVADAAHLDMLKDGSFDTVVSNMALMDIADAAAAIQEISRVLKPGGRFVASLSHPCFDVVDASGWVVEQMGFTATIWRKVSRYRELAAGWIPWMVEGKEMWRTRAYHRPLSWYFQAMRDAGLAVTALEEPEPTQEFVTGSPQGPWIAQVPLHVVFEARKIDLRRKP